MGDHPCLDEFERIMALLQREAANAAQRNKPTMWAYYGRMEERLRAWFDASVDRVQGARAARLTGREMRGIDGGIAGAALALVQSAEERCPRLPRDEAADLWAMGTYAARLLRAWGWPVERRSLRWLRSRIRGGE